MVFLINRNENQLFIYFFHFVCQIKENTHAKENHCAGHTIKDDNKYNNSYPLDDLTIHMGKCENEPTIDVLSDALSSLIVQ